MFAPSLDGYTHLGSWAGRCPIYDCGSCFHRAGDCWIRPCLCHCCATQKVVCHTCLSWGIPGLIRTGNSVRFRLSPHWSPVMSCCDLDYLEDVIGQRLNDHFCRSLSYPLVSVCTARFSAWVSDRLLRHNRFHVVFAWRSEWRICPLFSQDEQ